jgi:hypothetical protein
MKERRTAVVKPLAVVLAALAIAASTALGQWNLSLSCETYPSPEVSDWERSPGIVRITISHTTRDSAKYELQGKITSRELGEIVTGRSDTGRMNGAQTVQRDNRDFMSFKNLSYNEKYRSQIVRTNRLMEGSYTLNLQLVVYDGARAKVVQERSANFYILSFRQATLVAPADSEEVATQFPTFQWTPATTHPGFTVNYDLKLVVLQKGQTPAQAINNLPHHTARVANRTTYVYPNTARPLVAGKIYVWQVQAKDERGRALGEQRGAGVVGVFVRDHRTIDPPARAVPVLTASLTKVERKGSYYYVVLSVNLPDTLKWGTTSDLVVRTWNKGLQCTATETYIDTEDCVEAEAADNLGRSSICVLKRSGKIHGEALSLEYYAVPVLYYGWVPSYVVCDSVDITYKLGSKNYHRTADLARTITDVSTALRQAGHLTLTSPQKLFAWYDDHDVNRLLRGIGYLARVRNGAIAYPPSGYDGGNVRVMLRSTGTWGAQLRSGWGVATGSTRPGGFLFVVGEDNVINSWDITFSPPIVWNAEKCEFSNSVTMTDFPWADVTGDNLPDLAVGRAIGTSARDLEVPVRMAYLTQSANKTAYFFSGKGNDAGQTDEFEGALDGGVSYLSQRGYSVNHDHRQGSADEYAQTVQAGATDRRVVCYTAHGNVDGSAGLRSGNAGSIPFSAGDPLQLLVGYTCLWGRYFAEGNTIAHAAMKRQGTRNFVGTTEVSPTSINDVLTSSRFWEGYTAGNQSPGVARFYCQYVIGRNWATAGMLERFVVWGYNLYGDPW